MIAALLTLASAWRLMGEPLKIVTTLPDLADFASKVGGEKVEVYSMGSGVENPHDIQVKPSMITRLAGADLFIQMGLDLEDAYAPALLEESRNLKIQPGKSGFLDLSKGVGVRGVPKSIDRVMGDVHPAGNPHYNLDPVYAQMMVNAIASKLSELQPEDKAFFTANAERYNKQLETKIREWKARLAKKNVRFAAYHPVWVYFAERFGVHPMEMTIEPRPGVEPGPRHIEELIRTMKGDGIKLIIKQSFYGDHIPNEIAEKTGAEVREVPILVGATPEATDYIHMMDQIVDAFAR